MKNGIHYFVTGGGGAPLYDVDMPPPGITKKVEKTENFVIVNVDGGHAHIEARKPSGEIIDAADVGRQPDAALPRHAAKSERRQPPASSISP